MDKLHEKILNNSFYGLSLTRGASQKGSSQPTKLRNSMLIHRINNNNNNKDDIHFYYKDIESIDDNLADVRFFSLECGNAIKSIKVCLNDLGYNVFSFNDNERNRTNFYVFLDTLSGEAILFNDVEAFEKSINKLIMNGFMPNGGILNHISGKLFLEHFKETKI